MSKLLFGLLLAFFTTSSMAEWIPVNKSPAGNGAVQYLNLATIRKDGRTCQMWDLIDFQNGQSFIAGKQYLSMEFLREYDCKEQKYRVLAGLVFSGNMGSGDVVTPLFHEVGQWKPLMSGSVAEDLWHVACEGK